MDARTPETEAEWQESSWSGWYHHLGLKTWRGFKGFLEARPVATITVTVLAILFLFWQRNLPQPLALGIRIYFGAILLVAAFTIAGWFSLKKWGKDSLRWRTFGAVLGGIVSVLIVYAGSFLHDYVSLYYRYRTLIGLDLVELSTVPTTDHERILPLYGVYTTVKFRMNKADKVPTMPDLVRVGEGFSWTMSEEPTSLSGRIWSPIEGLLSIAAADPTPDLTRTQPDKVHFEFGETVLLGSNINVCVRRAFGPWRYLNYEPGNILRIKDDTGAWVIAVSLIRWRGIIFPRPEFGGVQIIDQREGNMASRSLLGCGHWIPPEEVGTHPFLHRQNIVPYEATRFMAASFRYQAGFTGPMFWNREGDVKIADLPEDVNPQPFALFFRMPGEAQGKLWHYFALQPNDEKRKGLAVSFFYPGDGIGKAYVLRHYLHNEAPLGVAQVETQLVSKKRQYDWKKNRAVEHRPFIRDIADSDGVVARRRFWLSTIVTLSDTQDGKPVEFEPGSLPEIALTDWDSGEVVFVDPNHPELWTDELRKELGENWSRRRKLAAPK